MLVDVADDHIGPLAIKRGAQDYLTKSRLEPDDLSRVIHNAVDRLELIIQRQGAEQKLRRGLLPFDR
jgi:FixJ family two-component response regulator